MRRDNENQPSFLSKATAALTTGIVGAAAFHRLGGGRLLSDATPRAAKFLRSVSDDLSGMTLKDYDADNIGKLFKKHISDSDSTLNKVLEESRIHRISTTGHTPVAAIIKYAELDMKAL